MARITACDNNRSSYDHDITTRNWGTSIDKAAVVGSASLTGGSLTLWNTVQGAFPQIIVSLTTFANHNVSAVRLLVRGLDAPQDMDAVCSAVSVGEAELGRVCCQFLSWPLCHRTDT
jgi:hypothetical protein